MKGYNTGKFGIKGSTRLTNSNFRKDNARFARKFQSKQATREYRLAKKRLKIKAAQVKGQASEAKLKYDAMKTGIIQAGTNVSEAIAGFTGNKITETSRKNLAIGDAAVAQNVNGGETNDTGSTKSQGFGDFGASGREEE